MFRTRRCAGFTLVELLVAATLFSVGLLLIASTAAAIARLERWAARYSLAAAAAESRLELLRAHPCGARAASDSSSEITEHWVVLPPSNGVALLLDSVSIHADANRVERVEPYHTVAPCR